ncbi:MAG: hypothetical protein FWC27_08545 [Firmicutes bacterium]|nr:hypothetical protein [Bacillota bacterium]
MKKMKIYLETTIFNRMAEDNRKYCEETKRLFKEIACGKFQPYTSAYVLEELNRAEQSKRATMLALITEYRIHVLPLDNETVELADRYVKEGVIPERFAADAQHIASACVHEMDCILSLNFQHINKVKTKAVTALVNQLLGYRSAVICTPMEVTDNDDDR